MTFSLVSLSLTCCLEPKSTNSSFVLSSQVVHWGPRCNPMMELGQNLCRSWC